VATRESAAGSCHKKPEPTYANTGNSPLIVRSATVLRILSIAFSCSFV
jgi:hypothetical protein